MGIRKPDTRNTHKDHFGRKGLMPMPYITDGQPPFDEGYFDGNGLIPIPYITDPNLKREDMIEFLSAESVVPTAVGLEGEEEANVSKAQETKDKINQYYEDKANMGIEEFKRKYPYGGQMMKMWKDELTDIVGEEESNKFMSNAFEAGEPSSSEGTDDYNEGREHAYGNWSSEVGQEKKTESSDSHAIEVLENTREHISSSQREDVDLIID